MLNRTSLTITKKSRKAAARAANIREILQLFKTHPHREGERSEIRGALTFMGEKPESFALLHDDAWKYIRDVLRPRYENDQEINGLFQRILEQGYAHARRKLHKG